jgi:hypothetical protein
MAYKDSPDDAPLQEAWESFCERLKAAGRKAFKDQNPATPLMRTDAFRFLTQNLGQAFDLALETKDTRYPAIHLFNSPTCKLGGDCADFIYLQAWIDGNSTYRITGNRGTAPFLNFTVQGPRPEKLPAGFAPLHEPFGDVPEANLFGHQLATNWDGSFELFIGGPRRGPNWLPTTPGARKVFIRQGFDRWDELPAKMRIERIGMAEPKPLPTPAEMITAMEWAGDFLTGVMRDWPDWMFAHGGVDEHNPNNFPPEADTADDKKRGRAATNMHWQIPEDEALIVEFPAHEGLWMLTNMGVFCNSMDYLYRPVSYTPSRTAVDGDGKIRMILAHDDPGFHNWIDTQGFGRGNLTYRHMLAGCPASLSTRLVKRAELADALPATSVMVTPEQRGAELWARFNGIRQRYGL